jgi:hypothetical protein
VLLDYWRKETVDEDQGRMRLGRKKEQGGRKGRGRGKGRGKTREEGMKGGRGRMKGG